MKRLALLIAACVLFASTAYAQPKGKPEAKLKVGDPAPKLFVSKWIKGGPVDRFEPGKIYVVECWATWCGFCRAAMPHVTRLQAKYKDQSVIMIGMDVWEKDLAGVEPCVAETGERLGYAVAMDDTSGGSRGKTAMAWLSAAGRTGIPCTFIVDQSGRLAWIGHPSFMERPLKRIIDGKYDIAEQAAFEAKVDQFTQSVFESGRAKDYDAALRKLDELCKLDPVIEAAHESTRLEYLIKKNDFAKANIVAQRIADEADDTIVLMRAAGTMINYLKGGTSPAIALKLAQKAYEYNNSKGWSYQSLLAKAYAANRQYDKAIELQTMAVAGAPEVAKAREEQALAQYKGRGRK